MSSKKDFKENDKIIIDDESVKNLLREIKKSIDSIRYTIAELSELSMEKKLKIQEIIEKRNPKLKDYDWSYNYESGIVTILYKKIDK